MPFLGSPIRKRLALGLASALVFVGATRTGFWTGSSSTTRSQGRQVPPAGQSRASSTAQPDGASLQTWGGGAPAAVSKGGLTTPAARSSLQGGSSRQPGVGEREGENQQGEAESPQFAALDQLERQMSAGMSRARESVVALEYTALDGPRDARRLATGVVINSRGDVLSVRIDPPSSAAAAGSGPEQQPGKAMSSTTIVAHDARGKRHLARWVAADPETGLTLLQIAPRAVRPIQIAAEEPTLGSQVFVVGNPFGLGHSVGRGHVAGLDRALKLGPRQLGGLIQVQAPLYPGDSGAVVANLRGQLLGLVRSGLAIPATARDRVERDNDFGFALPVRDVLWVADQLRAHGHVDRAYLGVRLEPVAPAPRHQQPATGPQPAVEGDPLLEGALLLEVMRGSPAAQAGLRAGDTIIAVDSQPIRSPHDLTDRLDRLPAQSMIHLEIVRGRGPQSEQKTLALRTTSRTEAGAQAELPPPRGPAVDPPAPPGTDPTKLAAADSTPGSSATPAPSPGADPRNGQAEPWREREREAPVVVSIPGPAQPAPRRCRRPRPKSSRSRFPAP